MNGVEWGPVLRPPPRIWAFRCQAWPGQFRTGLSPSSPCRSDAHTPPPGGGSELVLREHCTCPVGGSPVTDTDHGRRCIRAQRPRRGTATESAPPSRHVVTAGWWRDRRLRLRRGRSQPRRRFIAAARPEDRERSHEGQPTSVPVHRDPPLEDWGFIRHLVRRTQARPGLPSALGCGAFRPRPTR